MKAKPAMRLYGKRPVVERLRAAPQSIRSILLQKGAEPTEVLEAARAARRPIAFKTKPEFDRLAGSIHAQGVLAETEEFRYAELEGLLRQKARPTLFLLDRITDPQNLGAVLRTLACLGGFAVVLPRHDSVEVTESVLRVACGGENYVPVAQVTNLAQACERAKKAGYWIAGATLSGGVPLHEADWPSPLGIVLGSEGTGIRRGLEKHLELKLTLPMPGAALSYNAATAAGLIAYEITRRKLLGAHNG